MKLFNISDPRNTNEKCFWKKNDIEEMSIFGPSFLIILSLLLLISSKDKCPFNPGKNQVRKNKTRFYWHIAWISKFLFHNIGLRLCSECFKFIDGKVCQTLLIDCPFAWTVSRSSIKSWMVSNIHTMYNGYCFLPLCNVSS